MERRFGGGYGGGFRPRSFAPVKVGDELDVKIEAVGEKGDGIAKKEGFVLFVPNTKEGDEVRIRVTKVLRKVGFAEVAGQSKGSTQTSAEGEPAEEAEEAPAPEDSESFGEEETLPEGDADDFGEEIPEPSEEVEEASEEERQE